MKHTTEMLTNILVHNKLTLSYDPLTNNIIGLINDESIEADNFNILINKIYNKYRNDLSVFTRQNYIDIVRMYRTNNIPSFESILEGGCLSVDYQCSSDGVVVHFQKVYKIIEYKFKSMDAIILSEFLFVRTDSLCYDVDNNVIVDGLLHSDIKL